MSKPDDRRGEGGGAGGAPVRLGRGRVVAFAVIAVLVIAGGGTYVLRAARQSDAAVAAAAASESATPRLDAAALLKVPHLVVRNTALGPSNGELVPGLQLRPRDSLTVDVGSIRAAEVLHFETCARVSRQPAVNAGHERRVEDEVRPRRTADRLHAARRQTERHWFLFRLETAKCPHPDGRFICVHLRKSAA